MHAIKNSSLVERRNISAIISKQVAYCHPNSLRISRVSAADPGPQNKKVGGDQEYGYRKWMVFCRWHKHTISHLVF